VGHKGVETNRNALKKRSDEQEKRISVGKYWLRNAKDCNL
jgi:hypothetical protein